MNFRKYLHWEEILYRFIIVGTVGLLIAVLGLAGKTIFAKEYEGVIKEKVETGETKCKPSIVGTFPAIMTRVCKDERYFVVERGVVTDTVPVCSKSKLESFSVGDTVKYKLQ